MDAGWNTIDGNPTLTGNKDIDWILNLGDWKEDLLLSIVAFQLRNHAHFTGRHAKNKRSRQEKNKAVDRLHGAFRKETRHHAVPAGFGEPQEGAWDGFQRINTETGSGGFVGVFRQGAAESSRTVTVKYLKPTATYSILSFPDDKEFGKLTGKELLEKNRGIVCNPIVVRSAPANAVKYAKAIFDKI